MNNINHKNKILYIYVQNGAFHENKVVQKKPQHFTVMDLNDIIQKDKGSNLKKKHHEEDIQCLSVLHLGDLKLSSFLHLIKILAD